MCPHCRAFITTKDRTCPYCNEPVGARAIDIRSPADLLGGLIPASHFTTAVILLINVGLFVASALYSMSLGRGGGFMAMDTAALLQFGAKYSPAILGGGQWWRLVTAGFLHGGLMHIAMNGWVLYDLGPQVEEVYGTSRYLVIYTAANAGGFLLSSYWSRYSPSVGASAALFGLIGAMIALGIRSRTPMGAAIRGMYIRWAVYGLLFGLLPFFAIDNAAHLGGLTAGFVLAYIAGTPKLVTTPAEQVWRWAGWASVAITAYCFLKMYLSFSTQLP